MATFDELIAKSRELNAAGDREGARRVAQIAMKMRGGVSTDSEAVGELAPKMKAMTAGAVDTATLGFADEATGVVQGLMEAPGEGTFIEGYTAGRDNVRAEHERLQEAERGAYTAGQLGGGVATLAVPGAQLLRGGGAFAKAANTAADGALIGGLYGAGSAEGGLEPRAEQALIGAGIGGTVGVGARATGAGIQRFLDDRAGKKAIKELIKDAPTTEERFAAGQRLYDQIDEADVQISPQAFDVTRDKIREALRTRTGFDELPGPGSLTPNSARVMGIMDEAANRMSADETAALPFRSLDQMRRQAGAAAGNVTNKADQKAGMEIISGLDDFVNTMDDTAVVSGNREVLQDAIPQAREEWSRALKSQAIDDAIASSEDYLSGSASGLRNELKKLLKGKRGNAFTDAEKAVIRQGIRGSAPEQVLNLLGGGLGQLGQVGVGFGVGGPLGALAGAGAAAGSRKLSEAVMRKNAEKIRKIMATGGLEELPVAPGQGRALLEDMLRRSLAVTAQ